MFGHEPLTCSEYLIVITACSLAIIDSVLDPAVSYLHCFRIQKCFMFCGLEIFCPKERGRDGMLWTEFVCRKTGTCGRHCNGPSRSIKEGNLLSSWGIVNLSRTLFVELCFLQWTNLMRDLTVASDKYIQDEFVIITVLKYKFRRQSTFRLSTSEEKPCSFEAILATAHVHHFTLTFSSVFMFCPSRRLLVYNSHPYEWVMVTLKSNCR